jgi:hypothetical protein
MPYLVRIGRIATNKCGVGSRGYAILRRGCVVICRWGQVDVIDGTIYWNGSVTDDYYSEKRFRRSSEAAARKFAKWKKRILCTPGTTRGDYHSLPAGARIYTRRPLSITRAAVGQEGIYVQGIDLRHDSRQGVQCLATKPTTP